MHNAATTKTRIVRCLQVGLAALGLLASAFVSADPLSLPSKKLIAVVVDNTAHEAIVLGEKPSRLYRVALSDRSVTEIDLPRRMQTLALDETRRIALVAGKDDKLRFVDLAAGQLFPEMLEFGDDLKVVTVHSPLGLAVILEDDGRRLHLVDVANRKFLQTFRLDRKARDVAIHIAQKKAYILTKNDDEEDDDKDKNRNRYSDSDRDKDRNSDREKDEEDHDQERDDNHSLAALQAFDLETHAFGPAIEVSRHSRRVLLDEALNLAVVVQPHKKRIELVDLATGEGVGAHTLPFRLDAIALNPDTHVVVIGSEKNDTISVFDLETQIFTADIASAPEPAALAVSVRYNQAAVLSDKDDTLHIVQLPNPVPVLTEIVPPDVTIPAPAFALLAVGQHFVDSSEVHLDGQPLTTRWKDPQHVEADVPASVLAQAGTHEIKVVTPTPAGGESQTLTFTVQNPVPVLNSIFPLQADAETGPLTLHVTGGHFVFTSVVRFGIQALATTFIDNEHLSAVIPATLLAEPATVPVTVFNPIPGGGSSAAINFVVVPAGPRIGSISPISGEPGTLVTLSGSGFDPVLSNNAVRFPGNVAASVLSGSANQLVVPVPPNAQSGPITVTTPKGEAVSPTFTVQLEQDVTLIASPNTLTLVQDASNTFAIRLSSTGTKPFTGVVHLVAEGLPPGVSVEFDPPNAVAGGTVRLILRASVGVALQTFNFNIVGTFTYNGNTYTRTVPATVSIEQGGRTGVKGRFVTPDGEGIAGVHVRHDTLETTSDAAGNFTLQGLPVGDVTLRMDATPADPRFPIWPYMLEVQAAKMIVIPDWVITPQPPDEQFRPITQNAPEPQVITDARFPGFTFTIPAGPSIIGWDGVPKDRIAVGRITPDKLPVTPPPVPIREAYQVYFGTPMGGIPSAPIPVSVPNVTGLAAGEKTEIWYFDGSPMGGSGEWKSAGPATISADGATVVTDPGSGIPRFCGVCGLFAAWCPPLPSGDPTSPEPCKEGNPIELLSGYEMPNYGGLRCGGLVPREIGLSYNPVDGFQGRSGVEGAVGHGWVLDYDIVLADSAQVPQSKRLILPPNSRINFVQQSDGNYTAPGDPRFEGAVLRQTGTSPRTWEITFKDGNKWRFGLTDTVATASFLIEQIDPQGNVTRIQRRGDRKIVQIGDDLRAYGFTYGANNLVEEIRDPADRTIRFTYNEQRRIETMIDQSGGVTRYTYVGDDEFPDNPICPQGTDGLRIKSIQYPGKPNPTINEHSPSRRVLRQVSAGGIETRFEYQITGACVVHESTPTTRCTGPTCPTVDSWENFQAGWRIYGGRVIATTTVDANGRHTRRFSGAGLSTDITDAHGGRYRYVRDAQNRVSRRIDPLGRETHYFYDENSNVVREIRDAAGLQQVIDFEYDPQRNKPTSITRYRDDGSPLVVSRRTYDAETGNLTSLTDANNRTWTYEYTVRGQLASIVDPNARSATFNYNDTGDLTAVTDPLGNTHRLTPDAVGRTIETIDALGYRTGFDLNARDQREQVTDATQGVVKLAYDIRGNLTKVTNQNNEVIQTNTYDDADRLLTRTDGAGLSESFTYDGAGNLQTYTDRKGQTATFTYDENNRLAEIRYADGTRQINTYDIVGRLLSLSDANGTMSYQYDSLDRLTQVTTPQGWVRYSYDLLDRRTRLETPQQIVTYGYDDQGNLTTITRGTEVTTIEYDENNRRSRLNYPNGIVADYVYDAAGRLTSLTYQHGATVIESLTYTYDPNGNIIQRARTAAASKQESAQQVLYDPATNRLSSRIDGQGTEETFAYDANGNLTARTNTCGTTTYSWDVKNQLTEIRGFAPDCAPLVASFVYDAQGGRTSKTINGETTTYLYDGLDLIAEIGTNSGQLLWTNNIDDAIARYTAQGDRYLLTDLLSSTVALTDRLGNVVTTYAYSPFGETEEAGQSNDNPIHYTGRENDHTGLYYYRARYYAPELARFISSDPIGLGGGLNTYSYVGNNPLNFIDPLGLKTWVYINYSGTGSLGPLAGEGGTYFLVDPCNGTAHQWYFGSLGLGLGFGGALQIEGGSFEGPDDPTQISNWTLSVSGFLAAKGGVGAQITGTSIWGNGEIGSTVGPAVGGGFGISGMGTYSKYNGSEQLLPPELQSTFQQLAKQFSSECGCRK